MAVDHITSRHSIDAGALMATSSRSPHQLLTTDEAAVELGVDVREVRKMCRLDQLRSRRVGRSIRVPWSAIVEFTSGHDRNATADA